MSWKTNKSTGKKFHSKAKGFEVDALRKMDAEDARRGIRRDTFGINPFEMTTRELRHEILVHKGTIMRGQVGTPNVYVRIADLEREFERRKKLDPETIWYAGKRVPAPKFELGDKVYLYDDKPPAYRVTFVRYDDPKDGGDFGWHYKVDGKWRHERGLTPAR